jgi:hypothetical protein
MTGAARARVFAHPAPCVRLSYNEGGGWYANRRSLAGQGERGFRVVDVWASEDAFRQFGEKLMPILQAVGVEGQPEIYQAHTFVAA